MTNGTTGKPITIYSLIAENRAALILGAPLGALMVNLGLAEVHHDIVHFGESIQHALNLPASPVWEALNLHALSHYIIIALFLFAVGVEIRDEMREGGKLHGSRAFVPILAAAGGSIMPGLIAVTFSLISQIEGFHPIGAFSSSVATDIVFATLPLVLVRAPQTLRIFVIAAAVADDIFGVVALLVAEFAMGAGEHVNLTLFGIGILVVAAQIVIFRMTNVQTKSVWALVFLEAWFVFFMSGIEQALCWLPLAFALPMNIVHTFEKKLKLITEIGMGVFAFTAAGVALSSWGAVSTFMLLAWLVGKPLGFIGFTVLAVKILRLPQPTTWANTVTGGVAMAIPFTVASIVAGITFGVIPVYNQVISAAIVTSLTGMVATVVVYFVTRGWHNREKAYVAAENEAAEQE